MELEKLSAAAVKFILEAMQSPINETEPPTKSPPESSTVSRFGFFPMLPVELRLKIWRTALSGPRIVEVYLGKMSDKVSSKTCKQCIKVNTPPPALMQVCWESREVVLEKYWLQFCHESVDNRLARIDPAEDTIYIPWSSLNSQIPQEDLANGTLWSQEARESLKFMAIDERVWSGLRGFEGYVYFAGLEKFMVVIRQTRVSETPCQESRKKSGDNVELVEVEDEEVVLDWQSSVRSQMEFDKLYY